MEHLLILPLLVDGLTGHSADINYVGNMSVIYNSSKCNYQGYERKEPFVGIPCCNSSNIDFAFLW